MAGRPNRRGLSTPPADDSRAIEPVESETADGTPVPRGKLEEGTALCLSGGGTRALLYHVGALWRMNEMGLLPRLERISSVSGGSIVAGVLGMSWHRLEWDDDGSAVNFDPLVLRPLRAFSNRTHDIPAGVRGFFGPRSTAQEYAAALARQLYGQRTLQDLPDRPRFVINASNLQSTALFRFSKPYCADYRVGRIPNPQFRLADAVAASGAFPPFFAPLALDLRAHRVVEDEGNDLRFAPYTELALLADGGVYDNLGLETIYKRYRTLLVSDGGGKTEADPRPAKDWLRQPIRVMKILDLQVRNLRYRMLIEAYRSKQRSGAYWGIRSDIAATRAAGVLPCPLEATQKLARLPTRLNAIPALTQQRLINWGYASADAALRAFHVPDASPPEQFPYPRAGVG